MHPMLNKFMVVTTLCALIFLRMVDLAIFDAEHDHVSTPHVQTLASEMVHDHEVDEPSEHASADDTAMHVSFHALLSVYISAPSIMAAMPIIGAAKYRINLGHGIAGGHSRPPVPPPLA